MHKLGTCAIALAFVVGGIGWAAAQQAPQPAPAASPSSEQAGADPRMAQPPSRTPAEEPFYKLTDEAAPAKFSPQNAAKDARWWLDRGIALSDEQKGAIWRALADRSGKPVSPRPGLHAALSAQIPNGVTFDELPADLKAQIPYIRDFKYVLTEDKVLLVDKDDGVVAAVIGKN